MNQVGCGEVMTNTESLSWGREIKSWPELKTGAKGSRDVNVEETLS